MKPTNNFNLIAPFYDVLGYLIFGHSLKKSQLAHINLISNRSKVLLLGDGSGYVLQYLVKYKNCKKIDYIDASSKMTDQAKDRIKKIRSSTQVNFITKKIEEVDITEEYDVVIANYFFDLFEEKKLIMILTKIDQCLHEEGSLIVTDFEIKNSNVHSYWQKPLVKIMIVFFKITCNIEINKIDDLWKNIESSHLKKSESSFFFKGMIRSSVFSKNILAYKESSFTANQAIKPDPI
jgi:ubiquinone/menaquinone biosynthesis C-methylase UbiE